jgi:hypothetical protein
VGSNPAISEIHLKRNNLTQTRSKSHTPSRFEKIVLYRTSIHESSAFSQKYQKIFAFLNENGRAQYRASLLMSNCVCVKRETLRRFVELRSKTAAKTEITRKFFSSPLVSIIAAPEPALAEGLAIVHSRSFGFSAFLQNLLARPAPLRTPSSKFFKFFYFCTPLEAYPAPTFLRQVAGQAGRKPELSQFFNPSF